MSRHEKTYGILDLAKKALAPAALGVGLALNPGCGAGDDEGAFEEDLVDGKEDALKNTCGTDYPGVQWEIRVQQKLTSSRMKKIASCAIDELILAEKCGIACGSHPVVLYMAPPAAAVQGPVVRYATPMCATDVDWVLKPNTYLTASKMKKLVQCATANLAVAENCGIGCKNGPVPLYSAPPVVLYAAPTR